MIEDEAPPDPDPAPVLEPQKGPAGGESAEPEAAAKSELGSPVALVTLLTGAVGATFEVVSFILYFSRQGDYPAASFSLVIADGLISLLALIGAGITIKDPRAGALALAFAGVGSFMSDLVGLSTVPRMIPGGLMILSAVITFATRKETVPAPVEAKPQPPWLRALSTIGIVLHVLGGGFIGIGAGLVVPPIGVLAGWVIWAAILFYVLRKRKAQPWWGVAVPFIGIGAWVGLIALGSAWFGWSA